MTNPFAGLDIMISDDHRERFETYVQRQIGRSARAENQPFRLNVDLWFAAICLAVKKGLRPAAPSGKVYKAAEGVALSSDGWRPTALVLLAIGDTEDETIIVRPGEMLKIASGYANVGLPELFDLLDARGGDSALDHLSETFAEMLR